MLTYSALLIPSWHVSIYWLRFHLLCLMAFVVTSVHRLLSPPPHAVTFAVLFCLHWFYFLFFSFRLTHSLTLMHASLLENGCTSLPGESFTHSPAWFSHDPVDQKVHYYCPAPVGYNCCHIRSDLPEILFLFCWLAVTLTTQDCIVMKVNTEIDL